MKEIRPRQSRLFIDQARSLFSRSPFVFKVLSRELNGDMKITLHEIKSFDVEFANNFFYVNDFPNEPFLNPGVDYTRPAMLIVPFGMNGDE